MCGRFSLEMDDTFYPRYEVDNVLEIKPNYNVAPFSIIPVITRMSPKQIVEMQWGYIPTWSKTISNKYASINTRAETIETKPSFRESFINYRCLIPATGFYEWKKEEDNTKTPYYIHIKNQKYFSFAGIFSTLKRNHKTIYTCSIVTTAANDKISYIHDRMPVILSKEEEEIWLDKNMKDTNSLKDLLDQYNSKDIGVYEVNKKVNYINNNTKENLHPENKI
ncbi:SOS response-associated peptidase [Candidatus Dojkabacteria bacterium]|nr:SOS response-associated peptidase [Candidatus Dojkabacteria bacterium]